MAKVQKEVRYLNKDFGGFRADLIEFAKQYFPNTYNDFNEASPGMMFIEMASYVGDVLSYYVDSQFKEMLLAYAEDTKSIYEMAQSFGYKPKLATSSFTNVDLFQLLPAVGTGTSVRPDFNYALVISEGTVVSTTDNINSTVINYNYIAILIHTSVCYIGVHARASGIAPHYPTKEDQYVLPSRLNACQ